MKYLFSILTFLCIFIYSCSPDDEFITDDGAKLEFSTDTLRFDTVFTTLGSATRDIKVYNPHKQPILIDKIYFGNGGNTKFRMNVDGIPGSLIEQVEVPANDSIYIFMEVTIDPDAPLSSSPFVIHDKVMLETNGNVQHVVLEAWGQNANYPNQYNSGGEVYLQCQGGGMVWDDEKPYVIFGIMVIDDCTLTIKEGTQIYVHGGLESFVNEDSLKVFYNDGRIITTSTGTLKIEGTFEEPVTIQGDRLEEGFQEVWGQWFGIVLAAGSKGNVFDYVTVKNAVIGVAVDSTANLSTSYSKYHNTTSAGLYGINATIDAQNCLFYNNGAGSVTLLEGGDYTFDYCTIASYGVDADALGISDALCFGSPIPCSEYYAHDLLARFNNCIISGSRKDEIFLSHLDVGITTFDYQFNNCVIKIEEILTDGEHMDFMDFCNDCIVLQNDDVLFYNPSDDDYHLDTLSIAEGKAMPLPILLLDLDNVDRDGMVPDVGCYEYLYE